MSRGSGKIERRIGGLFAATKDRALSITDIAAHAYELPAGAMPDRKQRLSATRAAHQLLRRAANAVAALQAAFDAMQAEATAKLGRPPHRRWDVFYSLGTHHAGVDQNFADAMETVPAYAAWKRAWKTVRQERKHFDGVLVPGFKRHGWQATETIGRRLYFHPADWPVRIWAVAIQPEGVVWADAEITRIDNTYAYVRYRSEAARLSRKKLAHGWTIYRNVFFTSRRSGYPAQSFDQMWRERYWRPGTAPPPAMQMLLAEAIRILSVPADYTQEDVILAFRRAAKRCHPDHGGTEAQFIELVKARDRLLAALGAKAAAPKMPEFAPKGAWLRYGVWRPSGSSHRIGHTRRLTG
jgi:hypothetical protein